MKHVLLATAACIATTASANTNEIIVTATRIETPINQMASSVEVLTDKNIEISNLNLTPELLQTVPGVSMSRSGGPGQQTSVYIRGAKPQHTLVLIDGVRMNGQLDLSGYDMANLQLAQIERIEILKGPQSPLYGSDAMAGVINIITKKGSGPAQPYYDIEGGSYGTWRAATGVSGGTDQLNYSASVSHYDRQGQSALKNNGEQDGTENTTVAARVEARPTKDTGINLTLRYVDSTSDYDDGFGTAHGNFKYDTEQLVTRAEAQALLGDLMETKLGMSYLMLDRFEYGFSSTYDADTVSADWVNTFYLHDQHTVLFGLDGYRDDFFFDEGFGAIEGDLNNAGVFAAYQLSPIRPWMINLGARHDEHSEFKGELTYQASSSLHIAPTRTRLKGSYGTAFKAPNSYQLFASFGNPNLQPETSTGWEVGFEQTVMTNRLTLGTTWFNTKYRDLIDYNFSTFTFDNIAEAQTDGAEVFATIHPLNTLTLRTGYTYLDNDDESGGSFELRRPQHQIDLDITYAATKALQLNLYAGYNSIREDVGDVEMEAYTLVNLAARYALNKRIELYGRIENLLNEDYETVAGYNTDDLSAYAGIKVSL